MRVFSVGALELLTHDVERWMGQTVCSALGGLRLERPNSRKQPCVRNAWAPFQRNSH